MGKLKKSVVLFAVFLLVMFAAQSVFSDTEKPEIVELKIVSANTTHTFSVEVADEYNERRTGLMNRESLPKDSGMLFIFDEPKVITMWMKDTLIPLDMLFIKNGVILSIHRNAEPGSLAQISSGDIADSVLEINGGIAEEYGIKAGDSVRVPL